MASAILHSLCNYAGPQHFCHIAACSAWVPGTMLDHSGREVEPSLPVLPWPHRTSVIPLYSVTTVTASIKSASFKKIDRIAVRKVIESVSAPTTKAPGPAEFVMTIGPLRGAGI